MIPIRYNFRIVSSVSMPPTASRSFLFAQRIRGGLRGGPIPNTASCDYVFKYVLTVGSRTLSATSPSLQSLLSASPSLRERRFKRVFLRTFGPTHTCATICRSSLKTDTVRWLFGFTRSISPRDRHRSRHLPARTTAVLSTRTSRSLVAVLVRLQ